MYRGAVSLGALDALAGPTRGQRWEASRTGRTARNTYHGDYQGCPRGRGWDGVPTVAREKPIVQAES